MRASCPPFCRYCSALSRRREAKGSLKVERAPLNCLRCGFVKAVTVEARGAPVPPGAARENYFLAPLRAFFLPLLGLAPREVVTMKITLRMMPMP